MTALVAGLALGLAAGISPGPLQTLVVTSALQRGFGAGWRVAIAPLLTDAPIIALAVGVLASVPAAWLTALGVAGGLIVIAFGSAELWTALSGSSPSVIPAPAGDVWRGAIVNFVSPHPWVFWATVGGPSLVSAWRETPALGIAFVVGFYLLLVGSKVALAGLVAAGAAQLSSLWQRRMLAAGGALLIVAGLILLVGSL